jgi:DNA-binding NtrC family response regulator
VGRILLVEDDPDVRPLLEHVLVAARHVVEVAVTVAEACALVASRTYDLVLSDGLLSDGTGIAVADCAAERGMRTLIITGHAMRLPMAELQRHDYLLKPVRPPELIREIERRVGRSDDCDTQGTEDAQAV